MLFFEHVMSRLRILFFFFFFNDTATTEIYTLSLHDALPISQRGAHHHPGGGTDTDQRQDRKSTRLNSSHITISYAVFCLKKKKEKEEQAKEIKDENKSKQDTELLQRK